MIDQLGADDGVELLLVVTGTHLEPGTERARTELRFPPGATTERVPIDLSRDDPASILRASATLTRGLVPALERLRPDILLVLGDRWEILPVATAAVLLQIPLAHLHGGEVTEGAIDERFRHATSKLADIHLCVDGRARRRLLQLGEEAHRVTVTGAPALDRLRGISPLTDKQLATVIRAPVARPFALVTYHPPTVDRTDLARRADAVFDATATTCASVVATAPGPDPGGSIVHERMMAASRRHANFTVIPQLGSDYPAVLASADVMVGNSSSGLFEAPTFRVPVVNVGSRQQGRTHPANVIDAPEAAPEITHAINAALAPAFAASLEGLVNPFGDGHAARRIVTVLRDCPLDELSRKHFVDHHPAAAMP